ncbi:hypothetical protein HDG32_007283 [Paraburkholderia sp. CI2]|uniref:CHAT domain-containing protein n=1 Tax=Paraburkholderia sp. CI2 TaxID=2723093 RepID=UPI0016215E8A|nr:CHAT domain-containing protein [Paraburkholderia sp. CI2]MBB5471127.1 hypothetical protein [Paraburkholderia sp. CI2]
MTEEIKYLDFDLHIWAEGPIYKARVRESPAGTTQSATFTWPFIDQAGVIKTRLENAIQGSRRSLVGPPTIEEKILRDFGSNVFRAIFQETTAVATKFRSSMEMVRMSEEFQGLRLKLSVEPPELAMLPWEYMFDETAMADDAPQHYLCLRNSSPVVRFLEVDARRPPLCVDGPLRVLGMIANPNIEGYARFDIGRERRRIEEEMRKIPASRVKFKWLTGGTQDDLLEAMQDGGWHIFHFLGHGGTQTSLSNGKEHTEGFVFMEDRHGDPVKVLGPDLALFLESNKQLRLAVLNCCESANGTSFSSAGASLVSLGVPLVVAMQFAISNGAAARFSNQFYRSLVAGQSVEQALTVARIYMRNEFKLEWGIPVLFTRASPTVLFRPTVDSAEDSSFPATAGKRKRTAEARAELRRLFQ